MAQNVKAMRQRRAHRVRYRIGTDAQGRMRLSVFRSLKNIYAQIIDDEKGVTLASASTRDKDFSGAKTSDKAAAALVGALVAKRALKAGITQVVFDRGGYRYHGRVAALAEAAREHGLTF